MSTETSEGVEIMYLIISKTPKGEMLMYIHLNYLNVLSYNNTTHN